MVMINTQISLYGNKRRFSHTKLPAEAMHALNIRVSSRKAATRKHGSKNSSPPLSRKQNFPPSCSGHQQEHQHVEDPKVDGDTSAKNCRILKYRENPKGQNNCMFWLSLNFVAVSRVLASVDKFLSSEQDVIT